MAVWPWNVDRPGLRDVLWAFRGLAGHGPGPPSHAARAVALLGRRGARRQGLERKDASRSRSIKIVYIDI